MNFETIDVIQEANFQILKIPSNFKIDDNKVYIKKVGNSIQIMPFHNIWENFFDNLNNFSEDFMNEREVFVESKRENFDE